MLHRRASRADAMHHIETVPLVPPRFGCPRVFQWREDQCSNLAVISASSLGR